MEINEYKATFLKLKQDIAALDRARAEAENALARLIEQRDSLVQAHNALAPALGEQPLRVENAVKASIEAISAAGISTAVRIILDEYAQETFTAAQVRDRLSQRGWDWSPYANPLATVHSVLNRLEKSGHAKLDTKVSAEGAKSFYSAKRVTGKLAEMARSETK